jgi:hypothetical protein
MSKARRLVLKLFALWIVALLAVGFGVKIAENVEHSVHIDNSYWLSCQWVPRTGERPQPNSDPSYNAWWRFQGWAAWGLLFVRAAMWDALNMRAFLIWLCQGDSDWEERVKSASEPRDKGTKRDTTTTGGGLSP